MGKCSISESPESLESMARSIYDRAYQFMREESSKHKNEIVMILEAWWEFEKRHASNVATQNKDIYKNRLDELNRKMPRKVKRKRTLYSVDGEEVGIEEYLDFIFPDEELTTPGLKLL